MIIPQSAPSESSRMVNGSVGTASVSGDVLEEGMNLTSVPEAVHPLYMITEAMRRNLSESCDRLLNESRMNPDRRISGVYCEGVFDEWSCWGDIPAGHTANQSCPDFIPGFDPKRLAYKQCLENGSWYMIDEKPWTNYTTCVNFDELYWAQTVTNVYKAGYGISLIALIISLGLLTYLKSIRCARIILHMNLFASFTLNNVMWLIWYDMLDSIVVPEDAPPSWQCLLLHIVLQYFMLSNYLWMLCEGVYLHTVLVHAFVSEKQLLHGLHALGWGCPVLFVIAYAVLSGRDPHWYTQCWMDENPYKWLLMVPVLSSMLLNMGFLINIVGVLLVKLRGGPHVQPNNRPSQTALQALRATLLLVPLLGLNFLLTPFRPEPDAPRTLVKCYDILAAVTQSFQGLCVTIIFCFCNGEVISQVKRKWKFTIFRPRSNSFTATTVSYVAGEKKINVKSKGNGQEMSSIATHGASGVGAEPQVDSSGVHLSNHSHKVNV